MQNMSEMPMWMPLYNSAKEDFPQNQTKKRKRDGLKIKWKTSLLLRETVERTFVVIVMHALNARMQLQM